MKIFDLDSPLMNVLNKMADLMWLNILTLICCIPIITAGAAFTSMHYVALKIVRNEESYITRSFFKSFKTNFRQATLIWLMILLIAAVLGGDYYIITKSGIQFSSVLVVLIMAAAVLVICDIVCIPGTCQIRQYDHGNHQKCFYYEHSAAAQDSCDVCDGIFPADHISGVFTTDTDHLPVWFFPAGICVRNAV